MNYNPYYSPYGTQNRAQYGVPPYGGYNYTTQPQQMPSAPQNQPQAQPQYEMPVQDVRFVTAEEAKAFIVMPNSRVLLIDRNGMAYLKTADSMGQSQTQCYRFEAVNADGSPITPKEQPTQPDFKDFVKLQDVDKFGFATLDDIKRLGFATVKQVEELSQKIDTLQNQRMGVKQNGGANKPQV
jgi:hypothetical protein